MIEQQPAPEAVKVPSEPLGNLRWSHEPRSAHELKQVRAAKAAKAAMSAEEPISEDGPSHTHETEHTEVEIETALPAQGADDSQDTAGRDADADAATTTGPADDQAADTQVPADVVRLTKEALDTIPLTDEAIEAAGRVISPTTVPGAGGEDEDGWTHISDESHKGATAQVAAPSMISWFFGAGR